MSNLPTVGRRGWKRKDGCGHRSAVLPSGSVSWNPEPHSLIQLQCVHCVLLRQDLWTLHWHHSQGLWEQNQTCDDQPCQSYMIYRQFSRKPWGLFRFHSMMLSYATLIYNVAACIMTNVIGHANSIQISVLPLSHCLWLLPQGNCPQFIMHPFLEQIYLGFMWALGRDLYFVCLVILLGDAFILLFHKYIQV